MSQSPSLVPSTQRPVPLRARTDLQVEQIAYQGLTYWVIKDAVGLEYFRLQDEQYHILKLLDGVRSLEQIRDELQREFPTQRPTLNDLRQLITDLHKRGLVVSDRPGQAQTLIEQAREYRRKRVLSAVSNVLYIKLPGWDPERVLAWLYPLVAWMFRPLVIVPLCGFIVASWVLLLVNFGELESRVPTFQQFFAWPNVLYLWMTMGAAKFIHEIAHGLACKHFKGECHEIGMAFLVFSPCLYCDVSDSWVLKDKWKRIAIASAGMFTEILISAVAIFLWWNTRPGMFNFLCLNVFLVTTITTVIFNANPLLKFDGYYILSDLLEIPNLRDKADRMLRNSFARYCLGIKLAADPFMPDRGRVWFILFSLASAAYRWCLMYVIIFALYELLKPYGLQNLGLMLGVFSAVMIVGRLFWTVYKVLSAPRSHRMSYVRATATVAAVCGIAFAALAIPFPLRVEAPFVLEPYRAQHVYTLTPGRLTEVAVRPGQRVKRGDVLARLDNFGHNDYVTRLKTAIQVQKIEVRKQELLDNKPAESVATAMLDSLEQRLAEAEVQSRHLTITAPCDGVVIAPPTRFQQAQLEEISRLPGWHGTPLEHRNRGCWLPIRTLLMTIAPAKELNAVLVVDQLHAEEFAAGRDVRLKFDHYPAEETTAKIVAVSREHSYSAARSLSNKYGGDLPTSTTTKGEERLMTPAYQATVHLAQHTERFRPGVRGSARITVETRTAAEWAWRYLKRTFHFRM